MAILKILNNLDFKIIFFKITVKDRPSLKYYIKKNCTQIFALDHELW